jgi:hypothetical protein
MTKTFQNRLTMSADLIEIQRQSADYDEYMHGMMNGMLVTHSVFSDQSPVFHERRRRNTKTKIRHKGKK